MLGVEVGEHCRGLGLLRLYDRCVELIEGYLGLHLSDVVQSLVELGSSSRLWLAFSVSQGVHVYIKSKLLVVSLPRGQTG